MLSLEPVASHALTDLVEVVLASFSGRSPASVSPACPSQIQDCGASTFPVHVLDGVIAHPCMARIDVTD
jgi:hypothetical protein